jgi:hypothetical protein
MDIESILRSAEFKGPDPMLKQRLLEHGPAARRARWNGGSCALMGLVLGIASITAVHMAAPSSNPSAEAVLSRAPAAGETAGSCTPAPAPKPRDAEEFRPVAARPAPRSPARGILRVPVPQE